ncbi:DMATS type aromatic prenyltransferase [Actinoplanes lutulentus]|uniref:DMATS type aromatic prenyltransferase n=1 Tax=Actinoplanes lutulentus TaxID=1287878 RepID=A0A327ZKK3_9ACTN|nr:DMATS type aromatic prenyltransferase [Actinoplanes lutulentus]
MQDVSVFDHLGGQIRRLCDVVGIDPATPVELLSELLGAHGSRPLDAPPAWPSDVADDHTPIEFSIAYNDSEPPALRILAEAFGTTPGVRANALATYDFLHAQAERYGLSTRRLEAVRDLFATESPQGDFVLWLSLVFRNGHPPEFKVYFNPEVHGADHSPELVARALDRLGLGSAYQMMLSQAIREGELGRKDRLTFFALDLQDGPQARVKLYLSHHDAQAGDVARAASVVDGVDPAQVAEFCELAGRTERFAGRPLVGSYTITQGAERPNGYSIYVPIRSYVADDQEARERVLPLLERYRFDPAMLDKAIAAVTSRSLDSGVGLIAHVSLRLGPPRPGMTVYLSSEAYQVFEGASLVR